MPRIEPVPYEDLAPEAKAEIERRRSMEEMTNEMMLNQQIRGYAPKLMAEVGLQRHGPTSQNYQIRAHFVSDDVAVDDQLLEPRLIELVRVRSAQLAGCQVCEERDYGPTDPDKRVGEADRACLVAEDLAAMTERERMAIRFVTLMHVDHQKIDDDFYRDMATIFTTAEIVALGLFVAPMIGAMRFMHTLDLFGTTPPAIPYDPSQVNASRRHDREAAGTV